MNVFSVSGGLIYSVKDSPFRVRLTLMPFGAIDSFGFLLQELTMQKWLFSRLTFGVDFG